MLGHKLLVSSFPATISNKKDYAGQQDRSTEAGMMDPCEKQTPETLHMN